MYPGEIERLTQVHRIQNCQREQALELRRIREQAHLERESALLETARVMSGFLGALLKSRRNGRNRSKLNPVSTAQ